MRFRLAARAIFLFSMVLWLAPGCAKQENDDPRPKTTVVEFEPSKAQRASTSVEPPAPAPVDERPPAGPGKTRMTVLEDERCKERACQTAPMIAKLQGALPGLEVVRHDWREDECKALFDSEGLTYLPAFLFDPSVEKNPAYAQVARYLAKTPKGDLKLLRTDASFNPRAEICDNGEDDTGNGLVDCEDPACTGQVVCREEIPKRLDLFVMSMCPYGVMAMDSMSEVLEAFDRKIDFHIHYIADETEGGFRSLHGQAEVDENIRELCAAEHFSKDYQYMEYVWCRNRKIADEDWRSCTGQKGIEAGSLEKCFAGEEGGSLLRDDLLLAKRLGITGSPTWLANNRFLFHGIAPEAVKQNFCTHNPGLAGCEKKLSTKTPKPEGSCR